MKEKGRGKDIDKAREREGCRRNGEKEKRVKKGRERVERKRERRRY